MSILILLKKLKEWNLEKKIKKRKKNKFLFLLIYFLDQLKIKLLNKWKKFQEMEKLKVFLRLKIKYLNKIKNFIFLP